MNESLIIIYFIYYHTYLSLYKNLYKIYVSFDNIEGIISNDHEDPTIQIISEMNYRSLDTIDPKDPPSSKITDSLIGKDSNLRVWNNFIYYQKLQAGKHMVGYSYIIDEEQAKSIESYYNKLIDTHTEERKISTIEEEEYTLKRQYDLFYYNCLVVASGGIEIGLPDFFPSTFSLYYYSSITYKNKTFLPFDLEEMIKKYKKVEYKKTLYK